MRRITSLVLFLGAPVLACQPAAGPLSEADVAALRGMGATYAQAVLAQDAAAVAVLYADDAVEMPPNVPARVGRAAIRAAYESPPVPSSSFALTAVQIDGRGDLAYDRGTWTWTGVIPGQAQSVADHGKYLAIARRQADGSWLWTAVIWNSDTPLPAGQ